MRYALCEVLKQQHFITLHLTPLPPQSQYDTLFQNNLDG
jgi:hypothetical protein